MLLCLSLLLSLALPARAAEKEPGGEELLEVTLQIHSNRTSMRELDGLYRDNVFYIDYAAVCELTGCRIFSQDSGEIRFSMHGGLREISVTDDSRLTESYSSDRFSMDIPTTCRDGKLYVSAPHILRYMGASVSFAVDADASVHMSVSMPYTVLDLYSEYLDSDGFRFSWSEADGKYLDPEKLQYFAVVDTVYFGYDSHLVIQGASGSYSELVMEELYRDVVLQTVRTSGAELAEAESPILELLGDISGELLVTDSWINAVMAVADFEGADALISDILAQGEYVLLDDVAGGAKTFIKITGAMSDALQTVIQYSAVNDGQREVLANSLNRVPQGSGLYSRSPDIFDAAQLAQEMIDDEQIAAERAAKKILFDVAVDHIGGLIPIVSTIASAAEITTQTVQSIPFFEKILTSEQCVTVASVAGQIGALADSMVCSDFEKATLAPSKGTAYQQYARADMLMSLKASLLTRRQLLDSGLLADYAAEAMKARIRKAALLLNKGENAQCVQFISPVVDEDLTWIAKLAGKGKIGMSVISGQDIYYWQYASGSFKEGAYLGAFGTDYPATLVHRDAQGNEQALFDAIAEEFVVTSTKIFYTSDGIICSRNTDGSGYQAWCGGSILDVDSHGNYLVCQADDSCFSLNTWTGETKTLFTGGSFVASYKGVVYYEVDLAPNGYTDPEYNDAIRGKVVLRAVDMDGTNDRMIVTTAADLYEGNRGGGPCSIQHLFFGKEGLYFSYGTIAGTGGFFQGGRIVFVSYDGSQSKVLAGQGELVGANFGVLEDGSVITIDDQYILQYDSGYDYGIYRGALYWMDPVNGLSRTLTTEETLASGAASDSFCVGSVAVWGERAVILVHYTNRDPSQDFGWREYHVRTTSIMYLLDLESGSLTPLYTF